MSLLLESEASDSVSESESPRLSSNAESESELPRLSSNSESVFGGSAAAAGTPGVGQDALEFISNNS